MFVRSLAMVLMLLLVLLATWTGRCSSMQKTPGRTVSHVVVWLPVPFILYPIQMVTGDSGGNIYLTDGLSGDQLKLDYEASGSYYGVQAVHFADGTGWSRAQLLALPVTTDSDRFYGSSGAGTHFRVVTPGSEVR